MGGAEKEKKWRRNRGKLFLAKVAVAATSIVPMAAATVHRWPCQKLKLKLWQPSLSCVFTSLGHGSYLSCAFDCTDVLIVCLFENSILLIFSEMLWATHFSTEKFLFCLHHWVSFCCLQLKILTDIIVNDPILGDGSVVRLNIKIMILKFPFWFNGLRTQHSVYEDVGSIPGLTQWVNDPALLQAAA